MRDGVNPFRSERLRPGTVPFLFEQGDSLESLVERFHASSLRGEIVGPHGTGKSTLLAEFLSRLASLGHSIRWGTFAGGRETWSHLEAENDDAPAEAKRLPRIVAIDGFEQLSPITRWRWRCLTRFRGEGLLVTAHRSMGLPELHRTHVTPAAAIAIAQTIAGDDLGGLNGEDVTAALESRQGNLRDALFELYDRFEAARRE